MGSVTVFFGMGRLFLVCWRLGEGIAVGLIASG
jgi:hypothetical protein